MRQFLLLRRKTKLLDILGQEGCGIYKIRNTILRIVLNLLATRFWWFFVNTKTGVEI